MEARASIAFLVATVIVTMVQGSISAAITTPPESVTVLLNEGGRANFTCEGTGDVLRWTVQGLPTHHFLNQGRDITVTNTSTPPDVLSSVLSIAVLPNNDEVNIICQIYLTSNPFYPAISTSILTIRGVSPVKDIHWSNDNQLLSWSPPSFYSDDIFSGGIAATTYNVLVNGIFITNTTDTSVWLNTTGLPCTNATTVSVTASVGQYVSHEREHAFNIATDHTLYNESVTITYFNESSQTFVANLNCSIHCNQSCTYMIVGEVRGMEDSTQTVEADEKEEIFLYEMAGLRPCTDYTVYIRADKDSFEVPFSTYNVKDLLVSTEGNGSVSVQCVFVSGSTADECHVIFTDTSNGRNEHFNITGSDNSALISLPTSGVYDVTAYDISDDGNIAPWTCVQSKQEYVTLITATTSSSGVIAVSSSSFSTTISSSTSVTTPSSPTVITGTDGTSGNAGSSMAYIIISVVFVLMILIMIIISFTLCVVVVTKRKQKYKATLNGERAACHQTEAEMSHYETHDPNGPVAIDMLNDERSSVSTSGPVQGNIVDPYHVSTDELLAIRNGRAVQHNNSLVTTTSPQEGQTQNSSSPSSHESLGSPPSIATPSHDHDTNPTVTVGGITAVYSVVGRITDTDLVVNTPPAEYTGDISKGQPTYSSSSTYNSTAPLLRSGHEDEDNTATAYTTTADTASYVVVAKGTDITIPPAAVDQPSKYGEITGHIDKRGLVTTYTPPVPPKATQPTNIDINDDESTSTCDDGYSNAKAPPPAYDDIVPTDTECSHPQEEISDSTSSVSATVYSAPSGPTGNHTIIHNNIHLHFGAGVNYIDAPSTTSVNVSHNAAAMEPMQLPNKVLVKVDGRCLVSIVGTLSTSPPSPRPASFSDTGTPTTDTNTTKDHVSAELPIYVGEGEPFDGMQQQRHDDYNHQRSVLIFACRSWTDESSAVEDDSNIEATPIPVVESDSSSIEMFAADSISNEIEKKDEKAKEANYFQYQFSKMKAQIDQALKAAKRVFNRHKGSTKSATGFSSPRQANYNLLSKSYKAMQQFLYLKLSLLICIVNCIPFSDLNDVLLVYDRSTIQFTVVGIVGNYKHRVRKKDKEQTFICIGNELKKYMLMCLLIVLLVFSVDIYASSSLRGSLRVPILMIYNGLLSSCDICNPQLFAIYSTIIILLNFASTYYFGLIQKLSSTTATATAYLEPVDEIPHDPDPP